MGRPPVTRKTAGALRALRPSGSARPTRVRPEDKAARPFAKGPVGGPRGRGRRIAAPAAALAAALGLAACAGPDYDPNLPQGCPQVSVLRDASEVTLFDGAGRDLTDIVARAAIGDYQGECDYIDDPARVEVTLLLPIVAERGPAADGPVTVDYFVSVIDPDARVLGKQVFSTTIEFESGVARGGSVEELAQRIPLPSLASGESHGIIIGFQLTPEQLRYNREQLGAGPALSGGL